MYRIEAMTKDNAEIISAWKYPGEYSIYSFEKDEATLSELMNGEYVSCSDMLGNLVGYFCFGNSARIPTEASYTLDAEKVDIGLGLAPELCGHGYGRSFMQSGIEYAKSDLNARGLRLAVAAFNKRATALYRNCGFVQVGEVEHMRGKTRFIIMQRIL